MVGRIRKKAWEVRASRRLWVGEGWKGEQVVPTQGSRHTNTNRKAQRMCFSGKLE